MSRSRAAGSRVLRGSLTVGGGVLCAAVAVLLILEGTVDLAVFFAVLAVVLVAGVSAPARG